jgi:hypothetical protein
LPPALRRRCKRIRLRGLDFTGAVYVQPLEHGPCRFWYDVYEAYLAGDGKTVRPLPGKEAGFADFCRRFRKQFAREAARFVLKDTPPQPPRKPRRKKKGDGRGQ